MIFGHSFYMVNLAIFAEDVTSMKYSSQVKLIWFQPTRFWLNSIVLTLKLFCLFKTSQQAVWWYIGKQNIPVAIVLVWHIVHVYGHSDEALAWRSFYGNNVACRLWLSISAKIRKVLIVEYTTAGWEKVETRNISYNASLKAFLDNLKKCLETLIFVF